jgi:adenylylsulfate kinase
MVKFPEISNYVIWLTGLSGAGKTSVATALGRRFGERSLRCFILDGDEIRAGLNSDLSFSVDDRAENIRRIAEVAKLIASRENLVIVAAISPRHEHRRLARSIVGSRFLEVFVDTPLSVCEARDPKGLYKMARNGEINRFTGVSEEYQPPQAPDLVLKSNEMSIDAEVDSILSILRDVRERGFYAAK